MCYKGFKHSIETKQKISNATKGKNNPRYGIKLSQALKDKISKSEKGKYISPVVRKRMSLGHYKNGKKINLMRQFLGQIRQLPKYKTWKLEVIKRVYPSLSSYEIKKNFLQVHHLVPVRTMLTQYNLKTLEEVINCEGFWDIDNGIVLRKAEHFIVTQMERLLFNFSPDFFDFIIHVTDNSKKWEPKKYEKSQTS